MTTAPKQDPPDGAEYGKSLKGFGVNLLVTDMEKSVAFVENILGLTIVYADDDFAIIRHETHEFMLHADPTYGENPLLSMTSDGPIRGAGIELRLYGIDPDKVSERAQKQGFHILQAPTDKVHGLREAYIVGPDNYVWVSSLPI